MSTRHEIIDFPDADGGRMPGWLYRPKGGSGIGVCMIHDINGLRDDYDNVAAPFVEHGYVVLIPDIFHKIEPNYSEGPDGKMGYHYRGLADNEREFRSTAAAVRALKAMPETKGKVCVTGYCLGGTASYLATTRLDEVGAAAGYYATYVHGYLDELPNMRKPLILHMSETDRTFKPEDGEKVKQALAGHALAKCYVYPGTVHGFANNDHGRYDPEQTRIANARTFELFDSIA